MPPDPPAAGAMQEQMKVARQLLEVQLKVLDLVKLQIEAMNNLADALDAVRSSLEDAMKMFSAAKVDLDVDLPEEPK